MNTTEKSTTNKVIVCDHPLACQNLKYLRDRETPPELFRAASKRLGNLLATEALKNLPMKTVDVETPLEVTSSQIIDPDYDIVVAPILRAALILSEVMEELLPTARIHHLGMYRDEETLEPVHYYNKVPKNSKDPSKKFVYILDPMFATGGSAIAAVKIFTEIGIPEENITFVSLIAAPEGVENFRKTFKKVRLVTGSLDRQLNEKGYILPGLGDAGDRTYNTTY